MKVLVDIVKPNALHEMFSTIHTNDTYILAAKCWGTHTHRGESVPASKPLKRTERDYVYLNKFD